MGNGKAGAVRKQLQTLFNVGAVRELTDGQLLERFATDRGEAAELAFSVLVERHGPMVMRVCRGVLADANDAQDAFQATFLVLVKRARGLWVRDSIGPWLHQVAYRTAACARTAAARRRRLDRLAARVESETGPDRDFELEGLLHEEIDRLPDRYRSPVVLCDLQGRTYEQAARHLGWPVGTVKSRLSRGRERLRVGLIRRGVATEVGPLAVAGALKVPALSLPPALLDATTAAAVRFAAIGPAVRGSAVTLAQGVLRTMTMAQWWKVATVLIVAGATASGVEILGAGGPAAQTPAARKDQVLVPVDTQISEVKHGKLAFVRSTRGSVEATRAAALHCNVEGGTVILAIVPEGQRVKQGEVVAELDSAALRDRLVNQRITTRRAEANALNARLTREVAEIALKEYLEGVFRQDKLTLEQEIEGSRATLRKIEERLERSRKARDQLREALGAPDRTRTPADIIAQVDILDRIDEAELSRDRERRELERAAVRLEVLEKYTRDKMVKGLEGEIARARMDEQVKQAIWELEKHKENSLEKQIASCSIRAPIDGLVIHADVPDRYVQRTAQIERGASVRERQLIAQILDPDGPMRINLKVPEAWVHQVLPKMKARVKVDAFADATLDGVITEIAPLPDAGNVFSSNIKVYTTFISLETKLPGLRPGMTAAAEIAMGDRENAIGIPTGAVIHYDNKDHVALKVPDGRVEWREVILGFGDEQTVEVKEGLRDGEQVIVDPRPFLGDEQKARMAKPTPPARKKASDPVPGQPRKKPARPPR